MRATGRADGAGWRRFGPLLALSLALHAGLIAWLLWSGRTPRPEPSADAAFGLVFEDGQPDVPGEPDAPAVAAGPRPEPLPEAPSPSPPPAPAAPPLPPSLALPALPPSPPAFAPPVVLPPGPPPLPLAQGPPDPQGLPPAPTVWIAPSLLAAPSAPPPMEGPPEPPLPQQQMASLPRPPAPPARPNPPLAGVWMPSATALAAPARPSLPNQRAPLDLTLPQQAAIGRFAPETQVEVRGSRVSPNWLNAFRAWVDANKFYPEAAALLNQEGLSRVELSIDADARVREVRLIGQSGSVWLDAGLVRLFRSQQLPRFPTSENPDGTTLVVNMRYYLVR